MTTFSTFTFRMKNIASNFENNEIYNKIYKTFEKNINDIFTNYRKLIDCILYEEYDYDTYYNYKNELDRCLKEMDEFTKKM